MQNTPADQIAAIYAEVTNGNEYARQFIAAWHHYCHAIDDVIDGDVSYSTESLLQLLIQANQVYSLPFYMQHALVLQPVVASVTNNYADSVAWEKSEQPWKRNIADVIRQCGNDMILTIAWICGGYEHQRKISLKLREIAFHSQHKD